MQVLSSKKINDIVNQIHLNLVKNRKSFKKIRKILGDIPRSGGVYMVWEGKEKRPVYAGETKNLQERMKDMRYTVSHTLRRTIGHRKYSRLKGYQKGTTKKKFPEFIEEKLDLFFDTQISLSYELVNFGRIEIEEKLIGLISNGYNK